MNETMVSPDSQPLVSVLIPLYNHERYIVQCLESVLQDDYPNKELIVIDDGSSDGSYAAVKEWESSNRHRFSGRLEMRSRPNKGVSRTLNELLSIARGELIAFLSSDDYLLPGGIRTRVDYLRNHPDRMLVVADFKVIDESGVIQHESGVPGLFRGNRDYLTDERLINYELVFRWCIAGPVYMGRKELYEVVQKYDETLEVEDWAFCLGVLSRDLMGFVDHPVAAYRVHGVGKIDHLKYNQSMLKTVCDNLARFSGLRWIFLYGQKLRFIGKIEQLTKNKPVTGFLCRKAGQVIIILTKRFYRIFARSVHQRKDPAHG